MIRNRILAACLLLAPLQCFSAERLGIYTENIPYTWMTQPYRFYHQVDFRFSPLFMKRFGADYRLNYSLGASAVDLEIAYFTSRWGAMSVPATDTESAAAGTPGSQLALPRSDQDSWNQWIAEIGYSYRGRIVPLNERFWMQSARVALGYTGLQDQANSLKFSGISINAEFSLWYPILPRVMMGPTFGWRYGWMHLNGAPSLDVNRLPYTALEASLGAQFKL